MERPRDHNLVQTPRSSEKVVVGPRRKRLVRYILCREKHIDAIEVHPSFTPRTLTVTKEFVIALPALPSPP